jgi:hypothetical protein
VSANRIPSWGRLRTAPRQTVPPAKESAPAPRPFDVDDFLNQEERTDTQARTLAEYGGR